MYRRFFKRFFDFLLALAALPFWLLLLLIIAPIIFFQDKGSAFYNAPRLGKDGRVFKMYKFRSMRMNAPDIRNADGSTFNAEDDPRLTSIGKFLRKTSIDETPQILNVLKGDMSIIGPRPFLPSGGVFSSEEDCKTRLLVRPGITGYTQAFYRNSISQDEKVRFDAVYAKSVSLPLDVKIFFRTIAVVLSGKDVFIESDGLSVKNDQTTKG